MLLMSFAEIFQNYRNTIRESNCLNPDQDRCSVGPDLGKTVCKGYQQTTKVPASKDGINLLILA